MSANGRQPAKADLYIVTVSCAGLLALGHAYRGLLATPPDYDWIALAILTWVSGAFAVKIPSATATISVSEVFVFTIAILHGGPAATVTVALDGFLNSIYRGNHAPRRLFFNVLEPAVSIALACALYDRIGGLGPLSTSPAPLSMLVLPVFGLASSYLLLNTWLTAAVMALESGTPAFTIWRQHIVWVSVNFLSGASIALLLSVNMRQVSIEGLLLVLPLVFLLYLVFRTWADRVREAGVHVETVNRLYLSTVEALAIAIESKDQVTSNHVRRVQTLSMAIARRLGVPDGAPMRAIEAGALLHDIGKVAIPDYVLNKPGALTREEYEIIKLHAPVGAEILSAVDFPYPVVPIVRHHHENWDGTGYPDGISGEAIPIGARIISVVDCFDALTSDRPYRRALSDEQALAIIGERTGTMYAPAVVEVLLECYRDVRAGMALPEPSDASRLIASIGQRTDVARGRPDVAPQSPETPIEVGALDSVWAAVDAPGLSAAARSTLGVPAVAALLRTLTPATTVLVCRTDSASQSVRMLHAFGHGEQLLRRAVIALGEGITGWVAANHAGMINSDPALDWPEQIHALSPRPVSALAEPISGIGVLTLYTDQAAGFAPAHRAVAERAAHLLGRLLSPHASESTDTPVDRTVPRAETDAHLVALVASVGATSTCGLLSVAAADGSDPAASVLDLTALVLPAVRLSDGLVASAHDEVVAVLPGCDPDAEPIIVARLQDALDASSFSGDLIVGFAIATRRDGEAIVAGLERARAQRRRLCRPGQTPSLAVVLTPERRRA